MIDGYDRQMEQVVRYDRQIDRYGRQKIDIYIDMIYVHSKKDMIDRQIHIDRQIDRQIDRYTQMDRYDRLINMIDRQIVDMTSQELTSQELVLHVYFLLRYRTETIDFIFVGYSQQ